MAAELTGQRMSRYADRPAILRCICNNVHCKLIFTRYFSSSVSQTITTHELIT